MKSIQMLVALLLAALLGGCGTTHATVDTSRGEHLMLLGFDPVRVTDGIELSDDPILQYRSAAYSVSVARRIAR